MPSPGTKPALTIDTRTGHSTAAHTPGVNAAVAGDVGELPLPSQRRGSIKPEGKAAEPSDDQARRYGDADASAHSDEDEDEAAARTKFARGGGTNVANENFIDDDSAGEDEHGDDDDELLHLARTPAKSFGAGIVESAVRASSGQPADSAAGGKAAAPHAAAATATGAGSAVQTVGDAVLPMHAAGGKQAEEGEARLFQPRGSGVQPGTGAGYITPVEQTHARFQIPATETSAADAPIATVESSGDAGPCLGPNRPPSPAQAPLQENPTTTTNAGAHQSSASGEPSHSTSGRSQFGSAARAATATPASARQGTPTAPQSPSMTSYIPATPAMRNLPALLAVKHTAQPAPIPVLAPDEDVLMVTVPQGNGVIDLKEGRSLRRCVQKGWLSKRPERGAFLKGWKPRYWRLVVHTIVGRVMADNLVGWTLGEIITSAWLLYYTDDLPTSEPKVTVSLDGRMAERIQDSSLRASHPDAFVVSHRRRRTYYLEATAADTPAGQSASVVTQSWIDAINTGIHCVNNLFLAGFKRHGQGPPRPAEIAISAVALEASQRGLGLQLETINAMRGDVGLPALSASTVQSVLEAGGLLEESRPFMPPAPQYDGM